MDWLIKLLGGYTREEYGELRERYEAIPEVWERAVAAMKAQDRMSIVEGLHSLHNLHIDGALIVAPRSGASIYGAYSESSLMPVDSAGRIH